MVALFSRSIGVLNSKGKYIFILDIDDEFLNEEFFETIYNITEKSNFDIVEFKAFTIQNYQPNIKDICPPFFFLILNSDERIMKGNTVPLWYYLYFEIYDVNNYNKNRNINLLASLNNIKFIIEDIFCHIKDHKIYFLNFI